MSLSTSQTLAKDLNSLADALLDDVESVLQSLPEEALNKAPDGFDNNAFTLIYHLLGSARYWVGEVVGGQPSGRVRSEEFGRSGTKAELEERLRDTRARLHQTLDKLDDTDLKNRPIDLSKGVLSWGEMPEAGRTSVWVIAHDLSHTAYHLGQLKLIEGLWQKGKF